LFGHSNLDLTARLVEGVFTAQPSYINDLAGKPLTPLLTCIRIGSKCAKPSGNPQGTFREHVGNIQRPFDVVQEIFRESSWNIQVAFDVVQ
jgi:hypothetical protein